MPLIQVSDVLNRHRAELMEKRYRFNIGLLMCKFGIFIHRLLSLLVRHTVHFILIIVSNYICNILV